jgi:hypothetical protein
MLVAWYSGRPKRGNDFHRILFYLARYYNAMVNSEILGGGQNILDYAKHHNLLHYCAYRPSIFNTDKDEVRTSQRPYFINMTKDLKKTTLQDLADWLLSERALKVENGETRYVLTLETVYDEALLEELIKFSQDGNFDRISALLVLMAIRREVEKHQVELSRRKNGGSIFSRPLFTDSLSNRANQLELSEMVAKKKDGSYTPPPGGDLFF